MNWIDFFILFVLFVAMLNGYRRGLFKEISTFLGLIIGIVFAVSHADWLASKLEGKALFSPSIIYVLCFILIFAFSILLLRLLGHYFYRLVKITPLKASDKLGGSVFGIFKGVVALSLIFLLFIFPTPLKEFDSSIQESSMAKPIRKIVPFIFNHTSYFHPKSDNFLGEVQKGILLSNAEYYADDPDEALDDKVLLGMTDDDVQTLNKLNRYFGEEKAGK
jgi:membrane protein required for colicin V production